MAEHAHDLPVYPEPDDFYGYQSYVQHLREDHNQPNGREARNTHAMLHANLTGKVHLTHRHPGDAR